MRSAWGPNSGEFSYEGLGERWSAGGPNSGEFSYKGLGC